MSETLIIEGVEYTGVAGIKAYNDNDELVTYTAGGSGGPVVKKDVNFIDYDGTLLYSYTKAEINAMASESDLPANPSHSGLVAQGWNWTLAQIKAQLTAMPNDPVLVGQMYVTESGDTEIDVEFPDSAILSPILTIAVNGEITVDWGDNTTPDSVTGTSLTTRKAPSHTYSSVGNYTIKIHIVSGKYSFYCTSTHTILKKYGNTNQNRVYSNCVRSIRIGSGTNNLADNAFYYCYSLESITIPSSVTSIGASTFSYCYSLKNITIPSSVTSIGNSAFGFCYSLKNITIPSSVTSIETSTFSYCYSLASITIPSSVTSIGGTAFNACYSLASITIPSSVTSIGASAFYNCYSLESITIPSSVTSIGGSAFYNCSSLENITLPSGVTSIGSSAFIYCYSLKNITIPSSVTSIETSTFSYCYSLASITIPSSVTSIGGTAFNACYSLASITIPSSVTSIGGTAFSSCYGVQEYHVKLTAPPTAGTTIFKNIITDCIIYVPYSADHSILEAYKTATNWSTYASYMQEEPQ